MPYKPHKWTKKPIRVLTWHVHGNYLYYLTQTHNCQFILPVKEERTDGYFGKTKSFDWGSNVMEVKAEDVKNLEVDCILFQSRQNYEVDQYEILSAKQQELPKIYLEHDPPRLHPTDTLHPVQDPEVLLVQVTNFNRLMWDSGLVPVMVIEHGVKLSSKIDYKGDKTRGVVMVNNLKKRGRRLGLDVFEQVRKSIPLDLIGIGSKELGGLGEVPYRQLPEFLSHYRFFFNPIRYTSLGLSVCEAMTIGLPVVGLATTEMAVTIENGISGFVDTDISKLVARMDELINNKDTAVALSQGAKKYAKEHFSIERFTSDWESVFNFWTSRKSQKSLNALPLRRQV